MRRVGLVVVLALLACGVAAQTPQTAELTPMQVLLRARTRALADNAALEQYAWQERQIVSEIQGRGKADKIESDETDAVSQVDGIRYERVVARDGKALGPSEAAKEARKAAAFIQKHNEPGNRAKALRKQAKQREQRRALIEALPEAFVMAYAPTAGPAVCDCYVIHLTPRAGYHAASHDLKLLQHLEATLWIARGNFAVTRFQVEFLKTVSFGWVLARIEPGSSLTVSEAPVDGHWFEQSMTGTLSGRFFLVKSVHLRVADTYSDYRQFGVSTHVVTARPVGEPH